MLAAASTAMGTQTLPDEDLPLVVACGLGGMALVALAYIIRHRPSPKHPRRRVEPLHLYINSAVWGPLLGVAIAWPLSLGINRHIGAQEAIEYRGPVLAIDPGRRATVTIHDITTQQPVRLPLQQEEISAIMLGAEHFRRCYRGSLGICYREI